MQNEGGGRVLLIDDEPIVVRVIEHVLKRVCVVETATDGASGLERLRNGGAFALVLCDLDLPKIGGLRLLEMIRSEMPAMADRFVIMTGGATSPASEARLATAGVPVMEKPFNAKALVALVRGYLPSTSSEDSDCSSKATPNTGFAA
jgi:CheY-like chemotaxis protein